MYKGMEEKNAKTGSSLVQIVRIVSLLVALVVISRFVLRHGLSSLNALQQLSLQNPFVSLLSLLGLYALKSISFGLPYALLYAASANMYPLGWALAVNVLGIVINMQAPYLFGRFAAKKVVDRLTGTFPKLQTLQQLKENSAFLFTFLVKFIGKIPHELSNLFLGSLHIPYGSYIGGGVLGIAPVMVATTIAAANLDNPLSWEFLAPLAVVVVLALVSLFLFKGRFCSNSEQ